MTFCIHSFNFVSIFVQIYDLYLQFAIALNLKQCVGQVECGL